MHVPRSFARIAPTAALIPTLALAACGDGGTGPERLTTEDVGGVYSICALSFTPENPAFPPADVRTAMIDTTSTARLRASLVVNRQSTDYNVEFTSTNETAPIQTVSGKYQLGRQTVTLSFPTTSPVVTSLLLPERAELDFQAQPKELRTREDGRLYSVAKADYLRITGGSGSGVADQIPGRLTARFVVGPCTAAAPAGS